MERYEHASVRIKVTQKQLIKQLAAEFDISVSMVMRKALEMGLQKFEITRRPKVAQRQSAES